METSFDLSLALAIIKYKHKKKLKHSYRNIINYIILPKLQEEKTTKSDNRYKPRKKPRPPGKSIIPILRSFGILYETETIEELKRATNAINIDIRDKYEVEELFHTLKYLIQWDNSTKNLYLIRYVSEQLINNDFMKCYSSICGENKKLWFMILRSLDECILNSICHETRVSKVIKYKFIQIEAIYNYIFSNHRKLIKNTEYDSLLDEFSLNIAKVVFFKLGKWISNNKRYLIKFLSGTDCNETVKFELISLIIKVYNYNPSSAHINKISNCLKDKLMNQSLLNYLIICYLKLIKCMLISVTLTENKYSELKRRLLALLIINNDAESMKFYQFNF